MEIPNAPLKGVFFTHFILSVWAMQSSDLPLSYAVYNVVLLVVLLWALHARESEEPLFMGLVINGASVLLDIITIVLYFPDSGYGRSKFSIGMAIVLLVLRPITCVVIHRIRLERTGAYSDYAVPGLGDYFGRRGPYENIDRSQTIPQNSTDSGSPQHQSYDQSKLTLP